MINSADFGELPGGRRVSRWTVRNQTGAGLTVMDLGATILTLDIPGRDGTLADVVLGFDTAVPYLTQSPYFGAVVGRYANRIANGKFTLDGTEYRLSLNDGTNTLHGGENGFDKRIWASELTENADGAGVQFTLVSADGDQGFPGEVSASVAYIWTSDNRLIIDYAATSTKATPFSLSQHSYWNLGGAANAASVLDHELQISADQYLPVNEALIPVGELADVAGTPFDFRQAKPLGRDIELPDFQLLHTDGYDHNMVLAGSGLRPVARLKEPVSGRWMEVSTTQPGMQLYSGNFLDGKVAGKGGHLYPSRSAVALETQGFPDAPNQAAFPDAILRPGKPYKSQTIFAFGAD
jgi:aldose 1-epimerase